ncbi:MAG: ATP-dependent chaperone ClpB [Halobacteriovorax sp.]|nr:ATP-dependent chaperone ClpB [Halobacteriovorax sp.]
MHKFDSIVLGGIDIAQSEALNRGHTELTHYHLLYGLIKSPQTFSSRALKDKLKTVEGYLKNLATMTNQTAGDLRPNREFSNWLTYASSNSIQDNRSEISEKDLLKFITQIFPELDINPEVFSHEHNEESEVPTFLVDLNELAEAGKLDPVIGRSKEIRAVMEILGRRGKNNPVLVGPAGVGKTAIVEGLAEAIVKGKVPDVLKNKTVYALDMGALMAGTKFRGEFEERLQGLLKFIKEHSHESILFIDEMHQLVGAGKTDGAMDAANLLKPALARGELNCIGATTPEEYQKYILGDSALDRRFRSVPVDEPSIEDSVEIMFGVRDKLEMHHGVKISDDAIYNSVILSTKYITDKNLPDKAIDLVDEAASALKLSAEAMPANLVALEAEIRTKKISLQIDSDNKGLQEEILSLEKQFKSGKEAWEKEVLSLKKVSDLKNQKERLLFDLENAERNQNYEEASRIKYSLLPEIETALSECTHEWVLTKDNIASVISRSTGIPVEKILKSKQDHILTLNDYLKSKVFGQDEALDEIAETLITSHAGLSDDSRPLGSFLLKGPSGVGKTETAKTIAEFIFDNRDNMIRFDLSEFSEKHSVSKLIGAAPGYVGYESGGVLTEAVRRKPYSVILFDEIEKAHRDFSDILLQILDDGRLTDNKGRTIDFRNCVILLTTNSKNIELDFKPEVIGRLDAVLDYKSLGSNVLDQLITKELGLLNSRLADKKISIKLDNSLIEKLKSEGFSEAYGARPLHSVFNKYVARSLSKKIISGEITQGDYTLICEYDVIKVD